MKRTYLIGTLTFYCLVILSFYAMTKLQFVSEIEPYLGTPKDTRKFINACRRRITMTNEIWKTLWSTQYKNPCFNREEKLHCLPYFYVIGFPKCGTTDLFERMSHHPEFIPSRMKELHWLSRYRFLPFYRQNTTVNYEKYSPRKVYGLHLYTQMFSQLTTKLKNSKEYSNAISADFSPSTIWDNDLYTYMRRVTGNPEYYTHNFVYKLNPCAKLIVMMRDPTERLYSDYLFITGKHTAKGFHSKVKHAIQLYKNCMKQRSPRDCLYDYKISMKSEIRLRIGAYATYIAEWLKIFPREQMHFIRMEDYAKNTKKVLTDVLDFLDMKPASDDVMNHMLCQKPSNSRTSRGELFEPMYNKTYELLSQFYAPFNHNLSLLLQNKDYLWHNG